MIEAVLNLKDEQEIEKKIELGKAKRSFGNLFYEDSLESGEMVLRMGRLAAMTQFQQLLAPHLVFAAKHSDEERLAVRKK